MTATCNLNKGIEKRLIGAILFFPITNANSAEYSFRYEHRSATAHLVSWDTLANTWSLVLSLSLLKFLLSKLVSATIGSLFFHLRNSAALPGFASLCQCCPFLIQMFFRSRLIWTLNKTNNQVGSNTENTIKRIFLWVIDAWITLLLPLHSWRLSWVTVNCGPSTEDHSVLGSTSTCFVLLIDFNSSGIASVTASLLLIHFLNSNPWCERRSCNWLKTSIASTVVSTDLMKSSL